MTAPEFDINHLAHLSMLELNEDETINIKLELEELIRYADTCMEYTKTESEPVQIEIADRKIPQSRESNDLQVLSKHYHNGYIKVPKVI